MLKRDFVRLIKEKLSVTQKEAEAIIDIIFDTIKEQMILGEKITIPDFGIFQVDTRSPKQGYNPHNGERIDIPAYKVIRFKPSKNFKSLLKDNGGINHKTN